MMISGARPTMAVILGENLLLYYSLLTMLQVSTQKPAAHSYVLGIYQILSKGINGAILQMNVEYLHFLYGFTATILRVTLQRSGTNITAFYLLQQVSRINMYIMSIMSTFYRLQILLHRLKWRKR